MGKHGYVLLQVDLGYAVFVRRRLWHLLHRDAEPAKSDNRNNKLSDESGEEIDTKTDILQLWESGWKCQPSARHFFDLEFLFFPGLNVDQMYTKPYDNVAFSVCQYALNRHGIDTFDNISVFILF